MNLGNMNAGEICMSTCIVSIEVTFYIKYACTETYTEKFQVPQDTSHGTVIIKANAKIKIEVKGQTKINYIYLSKSHVFILLIVCYMHIRHHVLLYPLKLAFVFCIL